MALFQVQLGETATTVFDPTAASAVTTLFLCNTHSATVTVTLYLITGTEAPDDANAIWKDISIASKDTFVMNNERLILAATDFIKGLASVGDTVTVTGTFTTI